MNKNIIYGLTDPRTSEVRYIGKSTSGLARPKRHLDPKRYNSEQNYKSHWIKSLMEQGIIPVIVILKTAGTSGELNQMEIDTIAEYRANGARLTNLTDGGEGSLGWVPTEENKRNMSEGRAKYLASRITPLIAANKKQHVFVDDIECKHCNHCSSDKPLSEFGTNTKLWDKLHNICKSCNAARTAAARAKNPHQKLTTEELKQSYINRKQAISVGLKTSYNASPELKTRISISNSKPIEGTNLITGEKIYFNSALEAKAAGFQNSNIGQAIKNNAPYRGFKWKLI